MPSIEGELMLGAQDHFAWDPVDVQLEQIGKFGGSSA
jgi:hypothetical protein